MNENKVWIVILLGASLLIMGAAPSEEQLAQFRQLDAKPVAELKNVGLAQYLAARTIIQKATTRPSAGDMIAQCALKQARCDVAIPSRTEDLTKVHCVSIVSRSLAMALARNYQEYYIILSRIVWHYGRIGDTACTDPLWDWVPNNDWLLKEMTDKLGVATTSVPVCRLPGPRDKTPTGRGYRDLRRLKGEKVQQVNIILERRIVCLNY